jgi:hypothetical protein
MECLLEWPYLLLCWERHSKETGFDERRKPREMKKRHLHGLADFVKVLLSSIHYDDMPQ